MHIHIFGEDKNVASIIIECLSTLLTIYCIVSVRFVLPSNDQSHDYIETQTTSSSKDSFFLIDTCYKGQILNLGLTSQLQASRLMNLLRMVFILTSVA